MILHLAEDEKFIDHVINVFEEAYSNNNIYFNELPTGSLTLKHTKSKHPKTIAATILSKEYKKDRKRNILNLHESIK